MTAQLVAGLAYFAIIILVVGGLYNLWIMPHKDGEYILSPTYRWFNCKYKNIFGSWVTLKDDFGKSYFSEREAHKQFRKLLRAYHVN